MFFPCLLQAFSSDIFRVSFAAGNDGQLTTCGAGHIRFWRMASTFTGLKLQGDIGKFGRAEISDIWGCSELPDGKVRCTAQWRGCTSRAVERVDLFSHPARDENNANQVKEEDEERDRRSGEEMDYSYPCPFFFLAFLFMVI